MKRLSLLLVLLGFYVVSCERHEFEGENGTRQLHDPHGPGAYKDEDEKKED